jgi:acetyltransferase-like isoleucine patch superfamily enzyme
MKGWRKFTNMIFDLIDYILGEIKLIIYKIFYLKRLSYHPYSKFSRGFQLRIFNKGELIAGKNIVIRSGVKIRINGNGKVILGDDIGLNNNCLINSMDSIRIGSHTIIGQDVKMYDHDHDYRKEGNRRYTGFKTAPIEIGENVWIGSGCIILKGTKVGDNSVIAAGTVLRGNIPDNSIVYNEINVVNKNIY